MHSISGTTRLLIIFVIFLLVGLRSDAQRYGSFGETDSINFFRVSASIGAGKGYPQQIKSIGSSAVIELSYQRKKQLFSFGVSEVSDGKSSDNKSDEIFVSNSASAAFLTYGRVLVNRRFFASINAGPAFVFTEEKGAPICTCFDTYKKLKRNAVGLSVSVKLLKTNCCFAKGLEFFLNSNKRSSFGGLNFCFQLGRLQKEDAPKKARAAYYQEI